MKRGDIIAVAAPGDYGKPRPAVVVQSDEINTDSILVALITSALRDTPFLRLTVVPSSENKLKAVSQVMIDKIVTLPRHKSGKKIGRLNAAELLTLNQLLSVMLGLAD